MSWLCDAVFYIVILLIIIQIIRLITADADLQLLFKMKYGRKPESLAGKTVWITGASSGIGEYLAYDLAKVGCKLVLSARREAELERVKKQCLTCGKIKDEDIIVEKLDLLDFDSHADAVKKVLSKVSKVDILVNNGGRSQRALIQDTDIEVDRQLLELNTLGTISFTKAILPHFVQNKCGHIVVTSSIAGKLGAPISASYTASKHALQGWFEALRLEYAEYNVDVTLVCPGPVYSNITKVAFTGKVGDVHGKEMAAGDNIMKTERCTELIVAAIANNLGEVWISRNPILLFTYILQYMPDVGRWLAKKSGTKMIQKVRMGKI